MTSKAKLEALLAEHELHISKGSVQKAGRVIPKIVRALLDHLEEKNTHPFDKAPAAAQVRTTYSVDVGNLTTEQAKEVFDAAKPCAPCDVSIPNNPALIPAFKIEVVKAKRRPPARKKAETSPIAPAPKPPRRKPKAPKA